MKEGLIEKFGTLLQTEDLTSIEVEVKELQGVYHSETDKERHLQQEQWNAKEHAEGEEFTFEPNALDLKFEELFAGFQQQIKNNVAVGADDVIDPATEEAPIETPEEAATQDTTIPPEAPAPEVLDEVAEISEEISEEAEEIKPPEEENTSEESAEAATDSSNESQPLESEGETKMVEPVVENEPKEESSESDSSASAENTETPSEVKKDVQAILDEVNLTEPKGILIQAFALLLQTEEIAKVKDEAKEIQKNYRAETATERRIQQESWDAEEHEEGVEFQVDPNPIDEKFEELFSAYKERLKEHGRQIAETQKSNLEKKNALIAQLQTLITEEENIGKAFSVFNEIRDGWSEIGHVPGDKFRDVQDTFHRLREDFYYNINIYKELKENDLHINEKKKQELIEKAKGLAEVKEFRELDMLVRSHQKEWFDIGPSTRENYQALADEFFAHCREAIDRIKVYYDEIHVKQDENLTEKIKLTEEMKAVNGLELKHHASWAKKTAEVLELQKKWKSVGYAKKKENEEVWQEFRGLCDQFFDKKKAFYASRHDEQSVHQEKKEELVKKAKELSTSEDWKQATEAIIALQKEWKNVGPASRKFENKLWGQFRGSCDHFFDAKKEFYSSLGDRQEANLEGKTALLDEIEGYEMLGDKEADLAKLREFSTRWGEIGHIPREALKDTTERYHKALDEKYDKLDLGRKEKSMLSYKERIKGLKNSTDGDRAIQKERGLLRDKIDRLKSRVLQYENNMGFFTGSGAAEMKKGYEKKINAAKREIEEIKDKLTLFNE